MKKIRLILIAMATGLLIVNLWIPTFHSVVVRYTSSDRILLDRDGVPLQQVRLNYKERSLPWVKYAEISPAVIKAVVFAEDRRFYEHHGVDMLAMAGIGRSWLFQFEGLNQMRRGGSTLTMQLVKLLHLVPEATSKDLFTKRFFAKILQTGVSWFLDLRWSKQEILEGYLNLVYWRGELKGIGAASLGLFDKSPSQLSASDAAVLAGLLKFPSGQVNRILQRACFVWRGANSENEHQPCDSSLFGSEIRDRLGRTQNIRMSQNDASHFGRFVEDKLSKAEFAAFRNHNSIRTTIDGGLQSQVTQVLAARVAEISERNVKDGAALVVNHKTGEVLAYVGHVGSNTDSFQVDGVQTHRQAGSTLKPLLYQYAFEKKILTPESLIDDSPFSIPSARGSYRPENYDHTFHGLVPARVALGSSLNIPAVKVGEMVGIESFVDRLATLGFTIEHDAHWYGPAIALGTLDVSLWELAYAYATIAELGAKPAAKLLTAESSRNPSQLMDSGAAWLVAHILSTSSNRELSFGFDSPLSTSAWAGAKTGTSKDMRDNWCVGFSDEYVVAVWVGNYSGEPMWNVSGTSGAATAWADIISLLSKRSDHTSTESAPPETVISTSQDASHDALVAYFLKGTEPENASSVEAAPDSFQVAHIDYPKDDMIIALDPDIPDGRERVGFEVQGYQAAFKLRLDGSVVPCQNPTCLWQPLRGDHRLELADASGKIIDMVQFKVR